MGQTWPLHAYFCPFLYTMTNIVHNLTINSKGIYGLLGIQTWDSRIVIADESTEP